MATPKGHSVIVAGNVHFCDFRSRAVSPPPRSAGVALHDARDVRLSAETVQGACRDLIAGAPALVRRAELNAADLVSVASMLDELAFQAHVLVIESKQADAPVLDADHLQQVLLEAAAVTVEIQGCMSAANDAAETLLRRLREQAERALRLGRGVTQALDQAAQEELPAKT